VTTVEQETHCTDCLTALTIRVDARDCHAQPPYVVCCDPCLTRRVQMVVAQSVAQARTSSPWRSHCPGGHALTPETTRWGKNNEPLCLRCVADAGTRRARTRRRKKEVA
jgi:hypothetical protein